jgi:hypothetical protein
VGTIEEGLKKQDIKNLGILKLPELINPWSYQCPKEILLF